MDDNSLEFEDELYEVLEDSQSIMAGKGYDLFICIASGYDELAAEFIIGDALMMPIGFTIVFCYIMVVLGNYHCVETRVRNDSCWVLNQVSSSCSGIFGSGWMWLNRIDHPGLLWPELSLWSNLQPNAQLHSILIAGNWN